jgi:uncharacterized protein YndB with AHSA1/START domain
MNDRDTIRVCVKHRFSASPERVFDAWLDPEKASKFFFATATGQIVRVEIDARVGGGFTVVDRRNGEDVAHTGTYLELTRPSRIAFSFSVEKYSAEVSRVTIDIAPLDAGCEVTITHELDAKYADFAPRTSEGWACMLELAAQLVMEPPASCGAGLAQHAVLPAKVARMFAALAEMLERHRGTLVQGDPNAPGEDEAYRTLAASYREIALLVERAAARMAGYRELPMAAHDPNAFGPQQQAFEALVKAQNELLATLRLAAEQDQKLLAGTDA